MLFIFDKGQATEKSIELDYYSEQIRNRKLSANKDFKITKQSDFPDISDFAEGMFFETLEITDGDFTVPIIGTFNKIETFNTTYISSNHVYQITLTLGYEEHE